MPEPPNPPSTSSPPTSSPPTSSPPTSSPPTKCTPQAGFGAIAGLTVSLTQKFLTVAHTSLSAAGTTINEELLVGFLVNADVFASQCSEKLAALLRQNSSQPEVRETTEPVLGRLVRNRCFENLDLILIDYLAVLQQGGIDLSQRAGQLGDSRVRDTARQMMAPGPAPAKDTLKILNAEKKGAALVKIRDYLNALEQLSHELLDYGAIKLFGGDVDFVLQKRYLQNIKEGIDEKYNLCMATVESFDVLKQKMWEDQRAAETAAITAAAMAGATSNVKRKGGAGALFIGLACIAPIGIIFTLGVKEPYAIGGAVLSGVLAIIFVFIGINRMTKM